MQLFSNFQQSFLEIRLFAPNIAPSLCDLGLCTRGIDRNANRLQNVCLCQERMACVRYDLAIITALLQMLQFWACLKLTVHSITEQYYCPPLLLYSVFSCLTLTHGDHDHLNIVQTVRRPNTTLKQMAKFS